MNVVAVSGRLSSNALVFGKANETLKFTLACQSGYDNSAKEPRVDFVPCVFFRPPEKLKDLLVSQGKGKPVELKGRIQTSSFEQNGVMRYATEVVVDSRDFHLVRWGTSLTGSSNKSSSNNQKGDTAYDHYDSQQQTTPRHFPGYGIVGH